MSENTQDNTLWIQLVAGTDSQGMPVLEKLEVTRQAGNQDKEHGSPGESDYYVLVRSPLFVRDLAAGDVFTCNPENPADYEVIQRSGNLAIRLFRRDNISEVEEMLTPEVEKLDGRLELTTDRALVYTLHVNIGFGAIEKLFDGIMASYPDCVWYYGNIYSRQDGVTPLNWWHDFINQV